MLIITIKVIMTVIITIKVIMTVIILLCFSNVKLFIYIFFCPLCLSFMSSSLYKKCCMVKCIIIKKANYNTVIPPSEGHLSLTIYSRLMNSSVLGHKEV